MSNDIVLIEIFNKFKNKLQQDSLFSEGLYESILKQISGDKLTKEELQKLVISGKIDENT